MTITTIGADFQVVLVVLAEEAASVVSAAAASVAVAQAEAGNS